ncbi:MAG TPA: gephyrin-like molybdotransferase Glp [Thermoanaerobaculia bacterium]
MTPFRGSSDQEPMLGVEEAQARVLELVTPLEIEHVALQDALHRVIAEDAVVTFDVPEGDNSAMDGYALIADDTPGTLRVIDDIPAGAVPQRHVERGTASRIMTGALVPEGADAIAQVEITDGGSEVVRVERKVERGTHVRRRGEDMRAGDTVIVRGARIGAAEIGVLASMGQSRVAVARRPAVAILATGNEILDVGSPRRAGAVVNSNSYALAALAREAGADPQLRGIVGDTREATVAALRAALDCDFIITSGGVSAGAYDFVKDAVAELGADTRVWRVAMKPGKPVVVSRLPGGQVAFGLPGNPVSCMVAFILFVAPAIRKATGQTALFPPVVNVRLDAPLRAPGDRRSYLRVRVVARDGELVAVPMKAQGSHVSTSMLGANGLAMIESGVTRIEAGELAPVLLIGNTFNGM